MIQIKKTEDGSHTLFVPELNEHYHSAFGAIQESMHVFIHAGLNYFKGQDKLTMLEVGFGTGLNALLTAIQKQSQQISYWGIEAFPLENEVIQKLNYPQLITKGGSDLIFDKIHKAEWGKESAITEGFALTKIHTKIQEVALPENNFHLVYFDAFAPDAQPELWTEQVFKKIHAAMKPGGVLVTYSSKGLVKENLRAVGFTVKRLPGPPGKKHIVRAKKKG